MSSRSDYAVSAYERRRPRQGRPRSRRNFAWIAKDNPKAAVETIQRIWDRIERLAASDFADSGRPGRIPGTRELIVGPYIIVYQPHHDREEIVVLAIVHSARRR